MISRLSGATLPIRKVAKDQSILTKISPNVVNNTAIAIEYILG